jgi:hypothetical protein
VCAPITNEAWRSAAADLDNEDHEESVIVSASPMLLLSYYNMVDNSQIEPMHTLNALINTVFDIFQKDIDADGYGFKEGQNGEITQIIQRYLLINSEYVSRHTPIMHGNYIYYYNLICTFYTPSLYLF